jgi:hypothetical protein
MPVKKIFLMILFFVCEFSIVHSHTIEFVNTTDEPVYFNVDYYTHVLIPKEQAAVKINKTKFVDIPASSSIYHLENLHNNQKFSYFSMIEDTLLVTIKKDTTLFASKKGYQELIDFKYRNIFEKNESFYYEKFKKLKMIDSNLFLSNIKLFEYFQLQIRKLPAKYNEIKEFMVFELNRQRLSMFVSFLTVKIAYNTNIINKINNDFLYTIFRSKFINTYKYTDNRTYYNLMENLFFLKGVLSRTKIMDKKFFESFFKKPVNENIEYFKLNNQILITDNSVLQFFLKVGINNSKYLDNNLKNELRKKLTAKQNFDDGEILDSLVLNDIDNTILKFKNSKNNSILVFTSSLCGSCGENLKKLQLISKKIGINSVKLITISLDYNIPKWRKFINKNIDLSDNNYCLGKHFIHRLPRNWQIPHTPTIVLIDKDGEIKDTDFKFETVEEAVEKIKDEFDI